MVRPALCRAVRKFGDGALDADAMGIFGAKSAEHDDNPWDVFGRGMSDGIEWDTFYFDGFDGIWMGFGSIFDGISWEFIAILVWTIGMNMDLRTKKHIRDLPPTIITHIQWNILGNNGI